jgi:Na+/H+-translocating membrane pyrophosphatase
MLFVGGMIPVVFSAMNSVGKAMDMVYEVRRQFRNSGIMEELENQNMLNV